jgi:hypothetical protein
MSATTIKVNDISPRRQYTATAGQTNFDFPYPFFANGDLEVYLTPVGQDADDATDLLTSGSNYTVTGANTQDGGVVTLLTGATEGDVITILRIVDIDRTADYQAAGDLLAETLNMEQDTEIMISQQLQEALTRSLHLQKSDVLVDMVVPGLSDRAGRLLGFNTVDGTPEAGPLMTKVQSLADISDDIELLADLQDGTISLDVLSDLAAIKDDLDAVGAISADIAALSLIKTDLELLADLEDGTIATDGLSTLAGISDDITALLAISDDITTVADNVTDVTNFADVYIGPSASDPITRTDGSALQAGDMYFNTLSSTLKTYNGSTWVSTGGITDVVLDTTPQLGGDLDVNGHKIVSTSGNDIILETGFSDDISFVVDSDEKMSISTSRINAYGPLYNHTQMYFTSTSYPAINSNWWLVGRQASVLEEVYFCSYGNDFKAVYGNLSGSADTILMTGTGGQVKIGTRNPSTGTDTTYLTVDSNGLTIDNTNKININDNLEIYDVAGSEYIKTIVGDLNLLVKDDFAIYDNSRAFSYFFYDNSTQKLYLHANQYSDQIVINTTDITFQDTFIANDTSTFNDTVTVNSTVYVGSGSIEATAAMEVESTTKGFLPPRMTDTQRDAITSPATGLMIYNTTTNKVNFYNGSAWRAIDDSAV